MKKGRGERVRTVSYGFWLSNKGIHLEPNDDEQEIIAIVLSFREQGLTFYAIVEQLNQDKIPTRKGTPWHIEACGTLRILRSYTLHAENVRKF